MSLRRHTRLRREYLYRKSLEGKEKAAYEKKKLIKQAIEEGKPIPTELRGAEEKGLRSDLEHDDEYTLAPKTHIDDEYANAGVEDPRVCITTSRDPSSRLKQFAKEVRLMFPNAQRINRGGHKISEIVDTVRRNDFTDLVIVHEHRGDPDGMTICHLPYGPTATFTLYNTVMRHDIEDAGTVSEAYPHLVFDNFATKLGERVQNILKYLFPVPKDESQRVMSFVNKNDFISFRHHVFKKKEGVSNFEPGMRKPDDIHLEEVGPRFEMQLYEIKLGTADQVEVETEW
eukprot:CAMPEP_0184019710 /NCGR_PEP_ID=MMETSP0954-20121128/8914_1 /TAXON_ID=627963 /ORGANISM="Aplanochytrium sp, Strain PBS07" /LENGTH=285 /DNA_ID=CAMNT_0026301429 /DNA_START=102 /DNA_END=956 /DNA_ORIENTATION=-